VDITIDGQVLAGDGVLDLGGAGRIHVLACGDVFVVAAGDMTRDGRPLVGRATRLEWGKNALLRIRGRAFALAWRAGGGLRPAAPGQECRLCFGPFASAEEVSACVCEATFHQECFALRLDCPACGAPGEGPSA
jgi:hypothetical protein